MDQLNTKHTSFASAQHPVSCTPRFNDAQILENYCSSSHSFKLCTLHAPLLSIDLRPLLGATSPAIVPNSVQLLHAHRYNDPYEGFLLVNSKLNESEVASSEVAKPMEI